MTDKPAGPIEATPAELAALGITLRPEAMRAYLDQHAATQASEAQARLSNVESEYMSLVRRRPESLSLAERARLAELKPIVATARTAVGIPA